MSNPHSPGNTSPSPASIANPPHLISIQDQLAIKAIDALLANAKGLKLMADEWEHSEFPEDCYMSVHGLADSMLLEIEVLCRALRED